MKFGEFDTSMCKQIEEDRNRLAAAIQQVTGEAHKQVRSVVTAGPQLGTERSLVGGANGRRGAVGRRQRK